MAAGRAGSLPGAPARRQVADSCAGRENGLMAIGMLIEMTMPLLRSASSHAATRCPFGAAACHHAARCEG